MNFKMLKQKIETAMEVMNDVIDSYESKESLPVLVDDNYRALEIFWSTEGLIEALEGLYTGNDEFDDLIKAYKNVRQKYRIISDFIHIDTRDNL